MEYRFQNRALLHYSITPLLHYSITPLLQLSYGGSGTRTHDGLNIRYDLAGRCFTNSAIPPHYRTQSQTSVPERPRQDSNPHHPFTASRGRNPDRYRGSIGAMQLSKRKWRDSNPQKRKVSACFLDRSRSQSGNTSEREREELNLRPPSSQPGALSTELLSHTQRSPEIHVDLRASKSRQDRCTIPKISLTLCNSQSYNSSQHRNLLKIDGNQDCYPLNLPVSQI